MAIHAENETIGADDFELGIKRESPLRYHVTLPTNGERKGLVFVIPGFGEDNNSEYLKKLREFIADTYSLVCVTVMYHAIESRPNNGGQLGFEEEDIALLKEKMHQYGCPVANTIAENITILDKAISEKKSKNICNIEKLLFNQYELLTSSIYPGKGEYQNFGVIQAVDHLHVLSELLKTLDFNKGTIIAFGSSHGGYLANLLAKFSPNTFSAVFDNSSYSCPPLPYIVGRQIRQYEYLALITMNIAAGCFVISPWRLNPHEQNFYSKDRQKIRSFTSLEDIQKMANYGSKKTQYRFYHSTKDMIAKPEDKIRAFDFLKKEGFDAQLKLMDEKDVDGVFVKNLNHGMDLSLKTMFINLYPTVMPRNPHTDFELQSEIVYEGFEMDYCFSYTNSRVQCSIISKSDPL